jgi:hypothetical protein
MTDILDDQVEELLRKAEQRLKNGPASGIASTTSTAVAVPVVAGDVVADAKQQKTSDSSSKKDGLTVRAPPQPLSGLKVKEKVSDNTLHLHRLYYNVCLLHEEILSQFFVTWDRSVLDHRTMTT